MTARRCCTLRRVTSPRLSHAATCARAGLPAAARERERPVLRDARRHGARLHAARHPRPRRIAPLRLLLRPVHHTRRHPRCGAPRRRARRAGDARLGPCGGPAGSLRALEARPLACCAPGAARRQLPRLHFLRVEQWPGAHTHALAARPILTADRRLYRRPAAASSAPMDACFPPLPRFVPLIPPLSLLPHLQQRQSPRRPPAPRV